jgi:predicted peptidase
MFFAFIELIQNTEQEYPNIDKKIELIGYSMGASTARTLNIAPNKFAVIILVVQFLISQILKIK